MEMMLILALKSGVGFGSDCFGLEGGRRFTSLNAYSEKRDRLKSKELQLISASHRVEFSEYSSLSYFAFMIRWPDLRQIF